VGEGRGKREVAQRSVGGLAFAISPAYRYRRDIFSPVLVSLGMLLFEFIAALIADALAAAGAWLLTPTGAMTATGLGVVSALITVICRGPTG